MLQYVKSFLKPLNPFTHNPQLAPSSVNKILSNELGGHQQSQKNFSSDVIISKKTDKNNKDYIVTKVSTDDISIRNNITALANNPGGSLEEKLGTLKKLYSGKGNEAEIFIPIAQSQSYMGGVLKRAHFTLLNIKFAKDGKVIAEHIDSKGNQSSMYSLKNINDILHKVFGPAVQCTPKYEGTQGVLDDKNCGRFVIKKIIEKHASFIESKYNHDDKALFNAYGYILKNNPNKPLTVLHKDDLNRLSVEDFEKDFVKVTGEIAADDFVNVKYVK